MTEQELETSAQLSAQRFLLEILYANAFKGDAKGLEKLMTELMRMTRVASTTSEPIANEAEAATKTELQARAAAHLQRFSNSAKQRIESGRSV